MNYLSKVKLSKLKSPGVVEKAVEAVEYGAASYGFGYLQSRYRSQVLGVPVELAAGVLGKAVVLVGGEVMGLLPGPMKHVDVVANAAIGCYFHTLGVGHGAKASAGALPGKKGTTVLGAIPKAPHGDFLSARELAEMAR